MLSTFDIVLISLVTLVVFLALIYYYVSRMNISNSSPKFDEITSQLKPIETVKKTKSKGKKMLPKSNSVKPIVEPSAGQETEIKSVSSSSYESDSFDNEDDILALAALKGFDVSSIKRRNVVSPVPMAAVDAKVEPVPLKESVERPKVLVSAVVSEVAETVVSSPEHPKSTTTFEQAPVPDTISSEFTEEGAWSQVPTREEEIIKSLKQKLADSNQELNLALEALSKSTNNQERADKKILLLQEELKEQNRQFTSFKKTYENELRSLKNLNASLTAKISNSESSSKEVGSLKDLNSRLEEEIRRAHVAEHEMACQISELKDENAVLKEKASFSDAILTENARLQGELAMLVEVTKAEINMNRAELESEIAFHKAEHANAVGASTALHQEISQLKSEVEKLFNSEANLKLELKQLTELNEELVSKNSSLQRSIDENVDSGIRSLSESLDQARAEISSQAQFINSRDEEIANIRKELALSYEIIESLRFELSESNAKLESLVSEKVALQDHIGATEYNSSNAISNEENKDAEISALQEKLAEAEIKISSLQGDLNREIKRADVIKKVYETKIAMLTNSS